MAKHGTSARKERSRRYYEKNRDRLLEAARIRREANRERLAEEKVEQRRKLREYLTAQKDKPCMDCGESYPSYVMDFDHVRGDKIANLAFMVKNAVSLEMVQDEIAKCDLVCANCHRIRTHTR